MGEASRGTSRRIVAASGDGDGGSDIQDISAQQGRKRRKKENFAKGTHVYSAVRAMLEASRALLSSSI